MLNQVFVKKLVTKEVPDEFMIAAVIAPIKINLLHYYCFFDMVDNLARAMEIGAPIFKDIFGRSPLHYAIERRSRRCLDLILQSIINCNNEIQLEQNMHGLRDDVIKLLESHSDFILPFFESIFRKSEDPDHIFFAATRKPLPMTIFAPTMMPSVEDFVFRKDEITNQPEFLVQIWVSPLSWNFQNGSKESIKFLKAIEGCPAIEIYQTPLIRSLVRLK